MESVIIVTPAPYEAEFKARLERSWHVAPTAYGGWVIEDGGTRVYVNRNDCYEDFEPEDRARTTAAIPDPIFYAVDFRDIALIRRVLLAIADDPRVLVDNDHGVLLPGPEFIRLMQSRPEWDWRRDVPTRGQR
jgi:hypothetical protein